jgi:hypothetical protein
MNRNDQEKQKVWEKRMKEYEESGLSGRKWCEQQGVSQGQFWYWKKRLGNNESKKTAVVVENWVPLVVEDSPKSETVLTVRIGTVEIEIKSGYDAPLLQDVVRTLIPLC